MNDAEMSQASNERLNCTYGVPWVPDDYAGRPVHPTGNPLTLGDGTPWPEDDPEPPFNQTHHYNHTPAGPNPSCRNCTWLNWHQPADRKETDPLPRKKHTPEELTQIREHEELLASQGHNPYEGAVAVGYDDPEWSPIGDVFVVQWEDGSFSTKSNRWVSETYDMADCDWGGGVKAIMAADENGKLVPINVGEQERALGWSEGESLYFAHAPITAGTKRVGTVNYSDH